MPEKPQFSRREFIQFTSAAVLAASSLGGALSACTGRRGKKVTVGAHAWVYAATMPGYDYTPVLEQIFADLRYAGIEALELMEIVLRHDDAVDRLKKLSDQYEMPIIGTSYGAAMWDREKRDAILKDAEIVVKRLEQLGGRTFGTSVGAPPRPKTETQLDAQAELLGKLIALCAAHGITLNLHNHTYEIINNMHDLRGTLARIPEVKLGPDLNWLIRAGADPVQFIREFADHIVFLHLRDQNADGTWSEAIGEGVTDFDAIGKALHEINFAGDAMIELAHEPGFQKTRPLKESLKMSREFVRQKLGY